MKKIRLIFCFLILAACSDLNTNEKHSLDLAGPSTSTASSAENPIVERATQIANSFIEVLHNKNGKMNEDFIHEFMNKILDNWKEIFDKLKNLDPSSISKLSIAKVLSEIYNLVNLEQESGKFNIKISSPNELTSNQNINSIKEVIKNLIIIVGDTSLFCHYINTDKKLYNPLDNKSILRLVIPTLTSWEVSLAEIKNIEGEYLLVYWIWDKIIKALKDDELGIFMNTLITENKSINEFLIELIKKIYPFYFSGISPSHKKLAQSYDCMSEEGKIKLLNFHILLFDLYNLLDPKQKSKQENNQKAYNTCIAQYKNRKPTLDPNNHNFLAAVDVFKDPEKNFLKDVFTLLADQIKKGVEDNNQESAIEKVSIIVEILRLFEGDVLPHIEKATQAKVEFNKIQALLTQSNGDENQFINSLMNFIIQSDPTNQGITYQEMMKELEKFSNLNLKNALNYTNEEGIKEIGCFSSFDFKNKLNESDILFSYNFNRTVYEEGDRSRFNSAEFIHKKFEDFLSDAVIKVNTSKKDPKKVALIIKNLKAVVEAFIKNVYPHIKKAAASFSKNFGPVSKYLEKPKGERDKYVFTNLVIKHISDGDTSDYLLIINNLEAFFNPNNDFKNKLNTDAKATVSRFYDLIKANMEEENLEEMRKKDNQFIAAYQNSKSNVSSIDDKKFNDAALLIYNKLNSLLLKSCVKLAYCYDHKLLDEARCIIENLEKILAALEKDLYPHIKVANKAAEVNEAKKIKKERQKANQEELSKKKKSLTTDLNNIKTDKKAADELNQNMALKVADQAAKKAINEAQSAINSLIKNPTASIAEEKIQEAKNEIQKYLEEIEKREEEKKEKRTILKAKKEELLSQLKKAEKTLSDVLKKKNSQDQTQNSKAKALQERIESVRKSINELNISNLENNIIKPSNQVDEITQAVEEFKAQKAAIAIQSAARGYLQRNKLKIQKKVANTIQSAARGYLQRNKLKIQRETWKGNETSIIGLQSAARGYLQRKELKTQEKAATTIQFAARSYLERKKLKAQKERRSIQNTLESSLEHHISSQKELCQRDIALLKKRQNKLEETPEEKELINSLIKNKSEDQKNQKANSIRTALLNNYFAIVPFLSDDIRRNFESYLIQDTLSKEYRKIDIDKFYLQGQVRLSELGLKEYQNEFSEDAIINLMIKEATRFSGFDANNSRKNTTTYYNNNNKSCVLTLDSDSEDSDSESQVILPLSNKFSPPHPKPSQGQVKKR